jgi:cbb3-type cytochrome oxidase maturation protein
VPAPGDKPGDKPGAQEARDSFFPPHDWDPFMTLVPALLVIVIVAIVGASLALAAFFWALRTKQFSVKQLNEGAYVIFDSVEHVGTPTDQLFKKPGLQNDEQTSG